MGMQASLSLLLSWRALAIAGVLLFILESTHHCWGATLLFGEHLPLLGCYSSLWRAVTIAGVLLFSLESTHHCWSATLRFGEHSPLLGCYSSFYRAPPLLGYHSLASTYQMYWRSLRDSRLNTRPENSECVTSMHGCVSHLFETMHIL